MRNTYRSVRLRARMAAADALRLPRREDRAAAARAAASAAFEDAWAGERPAVERAGAIACAAGCVACCHQHVAVALVEAVAIADHVARDATLSARIAAAAPDIAASPAAARRRARTPCPLLDPGGRCAIYTVRPIRCRGVHSRDADLCRAQTAHPEETARERDARDQPPPAFPLAPVHIADAALAGLVDAQAGLGMASETLELVAALDLLLRDPSRATAALAGLDDLAEARLDHAARPVAGGT